MSSVELQDASGRVVFIGSFVGGVGGNLRWLGIWNNAATYVPGDVIIVLQNQGYYMAICVATNTNIDPFTDTGGTGKLGPHWFLEY